MENILDKTKEETTQILSNADSAELTNFISLLGISEKRKTYKIITGILGKNYTKFLRMAGEK